jgi:hypothetical protein
VKEEARREGMAAQRILTAAATGGDSGWGGAWIGRDWIRRVGSFCKCTLTSGGPGGQVIANVSQLLCWPSDLSLASEIEVCIVCTSGLVFT